MVAIPKKPLDATLAEKLRARQRPRTLLMPKKRLHATPKRKAKLALKRESLRDHLWPDSKDLFWSRKANDGWTTIPRVVPLLLHLIKVLSHKGNPANVYLDLWARVFDEGIVTIKDENDCAYSAGYSGTRAVRTWREHMLRLQELGFIRIAPEGNREIAHVLLLNPLLVCSHLKAKAGSTIPLEWWTAFVRRAQEIGARIPEDNAGDAAATS